KCLAIIGTDREPIRMVCLCAGVVYPGDRHDRSIAELDHGYLPVDQSTPAAIEDASVVWPAPSPIVADQRDRLFARRVFAVPAAPGGGWCEPAATPQLDHVMARFPCGAFQRRNNAFGRRPGPTAVLAAHQDEICRNKAECGAIDETFVLAFA